MQSIILPQTSSFSCCRPHCFIHCS